MEADFEAITKQRHQESVSQKHLAQKASRIMEQYFPEDSPIKEERPVTGASSLNQAQEEPQATFY